MVEKAKEEPSLEELEEEIRNIRQERQKLETQRQEFNQAWKNLEEKIKEEIGLDMVNIIDIISIMFFILAGSFAAVATLLRALSNTPSTAPVQKSLTFTAAGIGGIGFLTRWLLRRFG